MVFIGIQKLLILLTIQFLKIYSIIAASDTGS